ncbi:MAG TPA: hypothetical protein VI547_08620 [Anaerolineales bacterium]|nr:hypothetical protein [Anaerolineales bacterium]
MVESQIVTATSRTEPKAPAGVIASLTAGFETIASHIGVILLPVLLDLFLWLGPRLSISPLTQNLIDGLKGLPVPEGDSAQGIQAMIEILKMAGEQVNVFGFLSTAPMGVPSLMDGQLLGKNPVGWPLVLPVDNGLVLITLMLAFSIVGLFLGAIYFISIGRLFADDEQLGPSEWLVKVIVNWGRLTALGFILVVAGLFVGLLIAFILAFVQLLLALVGALVPGLTGAGVILVGLTQIIVSALLLWILLFLAFSVHGMVLKNRGVFGAMWDSMRLVRWNLTPAMALFLLIYLINAGLSYLWSLAASDSWLTLAGIGGHAFVSTSLIAATFAFYKDRYRWWAEMQEWLAKQKRK